MFSLRRTFTTLFPHIEDDSLGRFFILFKFLYFKVLFFIFYFVICLFLFYFLTVTFLGGKGGGEGVDM